MGKSKSRKQRERWEKIGSKIAESALSQWHKANLSEGNESTLVEEWEQSRAKVHQQKESKEGSKMLVPSKSYRETESKPKETKLYFAYGSNLNINDLCSSRRMGGKGDLGPYIRKIGNGFLPDMKLAFSAKTGARGGGGVANVVYSKGDVCPGSIFEIDVDGIELLDLKEGCWDYNDYGRSYSYADTYSYKKSATPITPVSKVEGKLTDAEIEKILNKGGAFPAKTEPVTVKAWEAAEKEKEKEATINGLPFAGNGYVDTWSYDIERKVWVKKFVYDKEEEGDVICLGGNVLYEERTLDKINIDDSIEAKQRAEFEKFCENHANLDQSGKEYNEFCDKYADFFVNLTREEREEAMERANSLEVAGLAYEDQLLVSNFIKACESWNDSEEIAETYERAREREDDAWAEVVDSRALACVAEMEKDFSLAYSTKIAAKIEEGDEDELDEIFTGNDLTCTIDREGNEVITWYDDDGIAGPAGASYDFDFWEDYEEFRKEAQQKSRNVYVNGFGQINEDDLEDLINLGMATYWDVHWPERGFQDLKRKYKIQEDDFADEKSAFINKFNGKSYFSTPTPNLAYKTPEVKAEIKSSYVSKPYTPYTPTTSPYSYRDRGYKKININAILMDADGNGKLIPVYTYQFAGVKPTDYVCPSNEYVKVITEGYKSQGIIEYVDCLAAAATNSKYPRTVDKVFVYGSLLTGMGNYRVSNHKWYLTGTITGFDMYSLGGFPAIVPNSFNTDPVVGEMIMRYGESATEAWFDGVDGLEGFRGYVQNKEDRNSWGNHYERNIVTVTVNDGKFDHKFLSWVYHYLTAPTRAKMEKNDWRAYKGNELEADYMIGTSSRKYNSYGYSPTKANISESPVKALSAPAPVVGDEWEDLARDVWDQAAKWDERDLNSVIDSFAGTGFWDSKDKPSPSANEVAKIAVQLASPCNEAIDNHEISAIMEEISESVEWEYEFAGMRCG